MNQHICLFGFCYLVFLTLLFLKQYKAYFIKSLLLLTILLGIRKDIVASHSVGGIISYECIGNDTYVIKLTIFRDCNASTVYPFDPQVFLGVFNNGVRLSNTVAPFTLSTPVPIINNNPCLSIPLNACLDKAEYIQTLTLPSLPGGYDIVHQRCCRNSASLNLVTPNIMGSTYSVHIPEQGQAVCNSSPTFNAPAPTSMCVGAKFTYDLSATDIDGDSLYYTFNDPYNAGLAIQTPPSLPPYTQVPWEIGYSTNYQIDANPIFTLDPNTGALIGTPSSIGSYSFIVAVKEYRNGVYLNEIYRDLLIYVNNCNSNPIPTAAFSDTPSQNGQTIFCAGTTLSISNNSINSDFFHWDFGDLTTSSDTSTLENPTYTYADTGTYNITLIANPGYPCTDTVIHQFTIHKTPTPVFNPQAQQCLQGNVFNFNTTGTTYPSDTITWDFGLTGIPQNGNGVNSQTSFSSPGTLPVIVTINNFGCSGSFIDSVTVLQNPTASFSPQNIFCNGLTVNFDNNNTNNSSSYWNFGDQSTSTVSTPNHNFPDSGSYNVMLVANQNNICFDTTHQTYKTYPSLSVNFPPQATQCLTNNSFSLNAIGNYNNSAIFNWNFYGQGNPSNTDSSQTIINYDNQGSYSVNLNVQNYGCTSTYNQTLNVYLGPSANFSATEIGCQPFNASFLNQSNSYSPLSFFWDFGNGKTSNLENPVNTYLNTGIFDVSLIISTNIGCVGSDTITLPNLITVNPKPELKYSLDPLTTYFNNHQISATDNSPEFTHLFDFGDGNTYGDSKVSHVYNESGHYIFQYTVTNEFNCSNNEQQNIWIKPDFSFFPPNSFTPNGDGLNDDFLIKVDGVKEYNIKLYNRWGEIIFGSNKSTNGWNGKYKGENVQEGVYIWKVNLKTIDLKNYKEVGKVNLIR
tara:strand:- start:338 stop:3058 length:2721 start_codon:yes stop_codon:yes gene_type:complete